MSGKYSTNTPKSKISLDQQLKSAGSGSESATKLKKQFVDKSKKVSDKYYSTR